MTTIRLTSQKTIFKGDLLELKEDTIQIGAQSHKYHTVYRSSAAEVFPLTNKYELYLISQYRYLYNKRVLEAIGGYMEPGETSLACAKRELEEEIGFLATQWEEIVRVDLAASAIKATLHLFLARDLENVVHRREESEDIEVIKMPLAEAVEKAALGEIHDAASIAGIFLLDKLRREKKI